MTAEFSTASPPNSAPTVVVTPSLKRLPWSVFALLASYWFVFAFVILLGPATLSQLSQFLILFYAPFVLAAGILVWWLAFSRQMLAERFLGLALLITGGVVAKLLADKSMGMG